MSKLLTGNEVWECVFVSSHTWRDAVRADGLLQLHNCLPLLFTAQRRLDQIGFLYRLIRLYTLEWNTDINDQGEKPKKPPLDLKGHTGLVELLTFSEGLYSGILTSDRILVTTSSDTSWETRGVTVSEWLH